MESSDNESINCGGVFDKPTQNLPSRVRDPERVSPLGSPVLSNPLRAQMPLMTKDMRFRVIHSRFFPLNGRSGSNRADPADLWFRTRVHTGRRD